jgi:hypothetical protein
MNKMAIIFISCGLLENESIIGDWLYDSLTNMGHDVYWYNRVYKTPPPADVVRSEIEKAKLVIAVLHRRVLDPNEKNIDMCYSAPPSVHQEIGIAWAKRVPIMPFVEKGVNPGMLPQMATIIPFDRENSSIFSEYISKMKFEPERGQIPEWVKLLGGGIALGSLFTYLISKMRKRDA